MEGPRKCLGARCVFGWGWGGRGGRGAASGQRRRGGWVRGGWLRAGEGSAAGLWRARASVGEGGEDGRGAPAERWKSSGLVLRGRKRVDGIPWKSGGEVLGRVGNVRVRGAWRRAGTPCPQSVRGGCVGAGEGRLEGMERHPESLGPCGQVVRGIVGDRGKRVEDEDPLENVSGRMSGKEPGGVSVGMCQGSWGGGACGECLNRGGGRAEGSAEGQGEQGGLR
ncbi:spidroin-1-like [Phacochoerus africanus]|uniref:spidroin-1-like n=1 Tax=Phacochoerus africanus TaxID=41426 RepID=UPI001FD8F73C|nr:spidroin-1-like [Phacochoerus africanus]